MAEVRTVIFLRHGEADKQTPDVFFGRTDTALTESGRMAAASAGNRLSRMRIDAVYTSPLVRCKQTARLLKLPTEIEIEEGFAEMNFGTWEGKSRAECRKDEAAWAAFTAPNGAPPEGESVTDFHKRVIEAYNRVLDKTEDKKVLLIVAHHSVICSIVAEALGMGAAGAFRLRCAPGSLSSIDYVDGYATLSRWNA